MKTIYARLGDLQLGETLEDGTSLGTIGKTLQAIGVDIQTTTGDLRSMGDVIEDLMGVWNNLDTGEKQAVAIKLAGKYQYNNLMALLENSKMYNEQLEASENSLGTINQQQEIYMESLQGKLNSMQSAFEGFINSIFNSDDIKPLIDDVTTLINLLTSFSSSVGAQGVLTGATGTMLRGFSSNIGDQVSNVYLNKLNRNTKENSVTAGQRFLDEAGATGVAQSSETFKVAAMLGSKRSSMNADQVSQANSYIKAMAKAENESIKNAEKLQKQILRVETAYKAITGETLEIKQNSDGEIENLEKVESIYKAVENEIKNIQPIAEQLATSLELSGKSVDAAIEKQAKKGRDNYNQNGTISAAYFNVLDSAISANVDNFASKVEALTKDDPQLQQALQSMSSYQSYVERTKDLTGLTQQMKTDKNRNGTMKSEYSQQLVDLMNQWSQVWKDLLEDMRTLEETASTNVNDLRENNEEIRKNKGSIGDNRQGAENVFDAVKAKEKAMALAELAGSALQVYSAFSAIKNLGSIWAEDDVSIGEKLASTFENLLISIPQAISAITYLRSSLAGLSSSLGQRDGTGSSESSVNSAIDGATVVVTNGAADRSLSRLGSKILSKFTGIFGKLAAKVLPNLIKGLTGPVGIALITGGQFLFGALEKISKERLEQLQKNAEKGVTALSSVENLQTAKDKVEELNEAYKDTGDGLDSLQDSVQEFADALGVSIDADDLKRDSIQKTIDKLSEYKEVQDAANKSAVALAQSSLLADEDSIKRSDSYSQKNKDYNWAWNGDVAAWTLLADTGQVDVSAMDFDDISSFNLSHYMAGANAAFADSADEKIASIADRFATDALNGIINQEDITALSGTGFVKGAGADAIVHDYSAAIEYQQKLAAGVEDYIAENAGSLSDTEIEGLRQGVADLLSTIQSFLSDDAKSQLLSNQAYLAADAIETSIAESVKSGITDGQEQAAAALEKDEVKAYRTMVGDDAFASWYQEKFGEKVGDANVDVSSALQGVGVVTTEMQAKAATLHMMGRDVDDANLSEEKYRTLASMYEGGDGTDTLYDHLSGDLGLSDNLIVAFDDAGLDKDIIDPLAAIAEEFSLDLSEILTQVVTGTGDFGGVVTSDGGVDASKVGTAAESMANQNALNDSVNLYATRLVQQAAQSGTLLSEDDAYTQAQEDLSTVLNSTLSTAKKNELVTAYYSGEITDLSSAVAEAATGFRGVGEELSSGSKEFLQGRYNNTVSSLSANEDFMADGGAATDAANEFVSSVYSGLSDDMVSQISAISERADFGDVETQVLRLVNQGYTAADAWQYALDNIDQAAKGLSDGDFEAYENLKGEFGAARTAYYQASQGYVDGDTVTEEFATIASLASKYNLSYADLMAMDIDWSKPIDEVEEQIQEFATGLDLSNDAVNTFRTNLSAKLTELNIDADGVKKYTDELGRYSDDTVSALQSLGYLDEENTKALVDLLDEAHGDDDKLIEAAYRDYYEKDGSLAGREAAESFVSGAKELRKQGAASDSDSNGFSDDGDSLWSYAEELGYSSERFKLLAEEAEEAGLSTDEFKQRLENLVYGLDSVSDKAQDAADALIRAGFSNEQETLYDEFGTATGKAQSDVQKMISGWSSDVLDEMSSLGLFDKGNEGSLQNLVNATGGDEELILRVIPFLDTEDLDKSIQEYADNPDNFISLQATQQVANNNLNDENTEFTSEMGQALGYSKEFSDSLENAAGQSNSLGDVWDVIGTKTYAAQAAVAKYNSELERTDYANQEREIGNLKEELEDANDTVEELQEKVDRGIDLEVNTKALEKAQEEADDLRKQINDKKFELEINVTGDLLDEADSLIEACGDVRDALDRIGDDYTTEGTLENLEALVEVFPDILDGATVTADGMVQLDQDVVESSVAAANGEIAAASSATGAKLDNMIEYAGAMAEMYASQATTYQTMADSETTTASEVNEQKKTFDDDMANAAMENQYNIDDATYEALSNEVENQTSAAQNQIDTSQQGADAAITNLDAVSQQSKTSMQDVIDNAKEAWSAVASIGTDTFNGGTTKTSGITGHTVSDTVESKDLKEATDSSDEADHSGSSDDSGSGRELAQQLANDAQQRSDAWNNIQGKLQARRAALAAGNSDVKTGSGSDSGSGSGSGSDSGSDLDTKEAVEDELDRYEKVNAQIDKLGNALERLNTEEERLVGFNRVDVIQKETANLKEQIKVYKEKLKIQEQERDEVKESLRGYGVTFDADGYIANYPEKFNEYLNAINALVDQYNAASSEEEQEAIEEQIDAAQDAFDEYKDLVEKYDELNSNSIEETKKELQDLQDQIEDMFIDLFNDAVEAADTIKDLNDRWADLEKSMRSFDTEEDDPFLAAGASIKSIAGYFDADTKAANKFFDTAVKRYTELRDKATSEEEKAGYQKLLDNILAGQASQGNGTLESSGSGYLDMVLNNAKIMADNLAQYEKNGISDVFGENQSALVEAAQTVYEQAVDGVTGLREAIDGLRDDIIDCIDDVADEIDDRMELWDRINDQLDRYNSLASMLHGDSIKGYEEQEKILELQMKANQAQLAEATEEAEYWEQLKSTLKEGSKEWKEADSKAADAVEKQNELLEQSIETAQSLLSAQANKSLEQWSQNLFGQDLDWTQSQWELSNRNEDYYLDDVNKAYNIQKLQSKYKDLLDGANTLSVQTKITDQMNQQLKYLREKTNLSAYDVSYAEAQLEILKQQIALEEAQANKSQMKLRRDSQGNYNYVYTADEGNVSDAEDALLDAKNNAYNLAKNQMKQTQEDSLSAIQQAKQTILDIWTDTALTTEQRAERIQYVIDNLKQYLEMTGEQLSTSNVDIVNSFYDMVDALNVENRDTLQAIYDEMKAGALDAFEQVDSRWSTTISNAMNNVDAFKEANDEMISAMQDSFAAYDKNVAQAAQSSKKNLDTITGNLGDVTDSVNTLASSFTSLTSSLAAAMEKIAGYSTALVKYQETYDAIAQENGELIRTIQTLKEQIEGYQRQIAEGSNESTVVYDGSNGSGNGSSGSGSSGGANGGNGANGGAGGSGDGVASLGDVVTLKGDSWYYYDSWRTNPAGNMFAGVPGGVVIDYISPFDSSTYPYHIRSAYDENYSDLGWVRLEDLEGYDTGGYTGEWSDGSGKLAMLHSKEIVLNASDTENILKAVESVRAMTEAMKGVSLAEAVGSISTIGRSIESQNGTVDQNVSITAEFPNATSADEIREAILGLNNQVLHYAHRRA